MSQPSAPAISKPPPSLLLCEALGFSPQLLLDDIIDVANNAVQDGVNGMEEFLQKWADERVARGASRGQASPDSPETSMQEVEQGLVAFQTLLEHHTDIALDFFEAWCLRNIFMIPEDLPVVLPHQENLDLTVTEEKEQQLMDEVEELRKRLDGQRKLNRTLKRALRTSTRQLATSQTRLANLSPLKTLTSPSSSSSASTLSALPESFQEMYNTLSSLPPLDILPSSGVDPGKRQWETTKTGYMNWALGRLLVKGSEPAAAGAESDFVEEDVGEKPTEGRGAVDKLKRAAADVGTGEDVRKALQFVTAGFSEERNSVEAEEDSAMEKVGRKSC